MFDPSVENPIPLTRVPKVVRWLPGRRRGRKLNIATVFRWAQRGLRGVMLETISIGGTKCTSEEALKRFFARLGSAAMPTESPQQRERQIDAAESALKQAGF